MTRSLAGFAIFALTLLVPLHGAQDFSPTYNFTVLAGSAIEGSADGPATVARFKEPSDTAVDLAGNVYVADRGNHTLRKITPAGVVSTLAGKAGEAGLAHGPGSTARFTDPDGLAVDPAGNLYMSDGGNIRKITPTGMVSNFASGSVRGIALDRTGNVYGARPDYPQIYKYDSTGTTSTVVAGPSFLTATGSEGFGILNDVAVNAAGDVFATDSLYSVIRKISGATVSTFAGELFSSNLNDGPASSARFSYPVNLAIDSAGNLYVTEESNRVIRRITPAGVVTSLGGGWSAGTLPGVGLGKDVFFHGPKGISAEAGGTIYFVDGNLIYKGVPVGVPTLTSQPQSQTVAAGSSVQFSVTTAGTPTYQWYFNGSALSGATSSTLSFSSARSSDAGDYTVVVSNPVGSVTSNKATLTVNAGAAGSGGSSTGGGGGGAPSLWFLGALAGLAVQRLLARR